MPQPGRFYGIGVGPGDPEALTLKAKRVLEQVEVIFVPKSEMKKSSLAASVVRKMLSGKEIHELVFPMTRNERTLNEYWAKATDQIVSELFKGKDAAFVTIGDPMLYSTYIYLFHLLRKEYPDLRIETLSGISAPFASAAAAGVSLAKGDEKLAIVPVEKGLEQELPIILENFDTVVLLKVGSKLEKVLGVLEKLKVLKSSVFVSHVGGREEYVERDITRLRGKDLGYLSVIIIKKPKRQPVEKVAKIYFIGAGPGDPELLTLKGKKIIESADMVIYAGSLVNPELLDFASSKAETFDSAKMNLGQIFDLFVRAGKENKVVARIHSGDPSIFGAIQEQIDWCEKNGVDHEVIPGVSSFATAAATLKKELTLPAVCQTIILTRMSGRTFVPEKEKLSDLAKHRATMCIFLSVHMIDEVVRQLSQSYPANTPILVVQRASWPDQVTLRGTLVTIANQVKEAAIDKTALILVGDVFKEGSYEPSKLYDAEFIR